MSIKISNLTKTYGKQVAVNQLGFELSKASITGFLGPNGAGKSTTMKMLCGLIVPDEGQVEVAGVDVVKNPLDVKERIGYLPESNPLYKELYVTEFLQFVAGLFSKKIDASRIQEVIGLVGLTKEKHKKIKNLSKGYRQRLGLAHAILHDPEVIILDEPMSGLDPNQLKDIRELIRTLGKEKTVLFSSHIMQEVEQVCDRVIIIDNGKLVADNNKEEIVNLNKSMNAIKLEIQGDLNEQALMEIDGVKNVKKIDAQNFEILCYAEKDVRPEIYALSKELNFGILEMSTKTSNLESIFQNLTGKNNPN